MPFLSAIPNIFYACYTGIPSRLPYLFLREGVDFLKINLIAYFSRMFHGDVIGVLSHLQYGAVLRSLSCLMILQSATSNIGKSASSTEDHSYICFDVYGKEKYISNVTMNGLTMDLGSTIQLLRNNPLDQWQSLLEANIVPVLSEEFVDQFVPLLNAQNLQTLLNDAGTRKQVFDVLALLLLLSSKDSMKILGRDSTPALNPLFFGDQYRNQTSNLLQWLLRIPFSDENDELRMYAARWVPRVVSFQNLRLLYYFHLPDKLVEPKSIDAELPGIISTFFDRLDEMTFEYCGIPNITKHSSMKNMKLAEMFDLDSRVVSKIKSRQLSAVAFISNLAQCIKKEKMEQKIVLEKSVLRLICFWAIATSQQSDLELEGTYAHSEVASSAYRELRLLNVEEIFHSRNVTQIGDSVQRRLIAEILSVIMSAQSMITSEKRLHKHSFLYNFVRSFVVRFPSSQINQNSIVEEQCNVLTSFDSILPFIIAGLVIKKDYLSICELTRFRLNLLAEIKRLERKEKSNNCQVEKILGKNIRKVFHFAVNKAYTEDDLTRQTARLCVMKSDDLNILGPILKSLLLEQDKSALVFFMKKVVRLKASFGELLKNSEFMLLDELVCELGHCEEIPQGDDYRQGFWKEKYKDQRAFHALKRGALFLQSNVMSEDQVGKTSPSLSLESHDITGIDVDDLVQRWIRKYFMRLLVNVTTKWKRGKITTKISAMRSLRVLLRFLPDEDSAQFVTQILGIVDGCMTQRIASNEEKFLLIRLRSLAVRCLAHYTRILLSCDIDCVGHNLCNIVVSLTPLFDDTINPANGDDPLSSNVLNDGIELLETLVDGEVGKALARYFESVPFLPEDSRLQNVRDALQRHGINFESLLLLSTQLGSSDIPHSKVESISSTCSASTDDGSSSFIQTNKLHMALRKRLYYLEKFLNHENDNVRKQCLSHIIGLVRGHRDLFHSAAKIDDASIRFLTVTLERPSSCGKWQIDLLIMDVNLGTSC